MGRHSSLLLFLQPQLMVFRAYPQHLCVALRALFFLAWHPALVRNPCFALGADAFTACAHHVLTFFALHVDLPLLILL